MPIHVPRFLSNPLMLRVPYFLLFSLHKRPQNKKGIVLLGYLSTSCRQATIKAAWAKECLTTCLRSAIREQIGQVKDSFFVLTLRRKTLNHFLGLDFGAVLKAHRWGHGFRQPQLRALKSKPHVSYDLNS